MHAVSLFHLPSHYHFSPWGSRCQFLPRLIIALLASPCNGPILSNPEHRARALPMTKDYFIDPTPLFLLSVSLSHFSTFSCPVVISSPLSSAVSYHWVHMTPCGAKRGPRGVIRSRPAVDAWLFLQHGSLNPAPAFVEWRHGITAECTIQCRWRSGYQKKGEIMRKHVCLDIEGHYST